MEKHIFNVHYTGNAKRFQGICEPIEAFTKREAVEKYYAAMLDENYFPANPNTEFGGYIYDCDGNLIADENDETIDYDGGYFYAFTAPK